LLPLTLQIKYIIISLSSLNNCLLFELLSRQLLGNKLEQDTLRLVSAESVLILGPTWICSGRHC